MIVNVLPVFIMAIVCFGFAKIVGFNHQWLWGLAVPAIYLVFYGTGLGAYLIVHAWAYEIQVNDLTVIVSLAIPVYVLLLVTGKISRKND